MTENADKKEDFKSEDRIFRDLRVDNHPDMDVDAVIRDVVSKLGI